MPKDQPVDELDRCLKAIYLELPKSVADDVNRIVRKAIQAECNRARKEMADNLIDQEVKLENTFSDDSKICVGIKLMADEVREYYDDGVYSKN